MAAPRRVVLGVSGSIAAYKSVYLLRLLRKSGAEVQVVMTPAAEEFVGRITFSAISGREVLDGFTSEKNSWNNHIHLAQWAELIIIAPATANTIAKMAHGLCDDLLLAICLSARCPIVIVPAMDRDMWNHRSTKNNIATLKGLGYRVLPVGEGELASGLEGEGRMIEPEQIIKAIRNPSKPSKKNSTNIRVLITAGPTYEPIDAVRFIGNRSTGKMGIALAESFAEQGAEVTLILGPTDLRPSDPTIRVVDVSTARQMFAAAMKAFPKSNIIVGAAAVADFRPRRVAKKKIKKEDGLRRIELEETPDILLEMGRVKKKNQLLVGFALETENELNNARKKLKSKNLDLVALNSLNDKGAGFGHETNKITLIWRNNKVVRFGLMPKSEMASKIVSLIISKYA